MKKGDCSKIQATARVEFDDKIGDMVPCNAHTPNQIQKLLVNLVSLREHGPLHIQWIPAALRRPYVRFRVWITVCHIEQAALKEEKQWKLGLNRIHDIKTPIAASQQEVNEFIRTNRDLYNEYVRLDASFAELESEFPALSKRARVAIQKAMRVVRNTRKLYIFNDDEKALQLSQQEYEQGKLLDLETFANGLQGV
jgi:alpha-D-ribose 1-methylphosphonate 5-triphosphate diphosphatase PhnM